MEEQAYIWVDLEKEHLALEILDLDADKCALLFFFHIFLI